MCSVISKTAYLDALLASLVSYVRLQLLTEEVMAGFMYLTAVEQYLEARTSSNRGKLDVADIEMSDRCWPVAFFFLSLLLSGS